MVTRQQAKEKALACTNEMIRLRGGNSAAIQMPRKGKCIWSWNEYKKAIIDDSNLMDGNKEVIGTNPIDSFYRYLVYAEEHRLATNL